MTSAEQQQLAAIARHLTDESPEWARAFTDAGREPERDRRRAWIAAGVVTAMVSLALLIVGLAARMTALSVEAVCPVSTYLVLAVVERCRRGRTAPGR